MMLERWRSEQQAEQKVIKSIVLQVLVADAMPKISDDAARIAATFRNLYAMLSPLTQPPVVLNPVLSIENLSKNWTADDFRDSERNCVKRWKSSPRRRRLTNSSTKLTHFANSLAATSPSPAPISSA